MRHMEQGRNRSPFPYGGLTIHSLRIRLRVEQETVLPSYKGSTYRGLLGHALVGAYCPFRQEACAECRRRDACPYPNLFKPHLLKPTGGVPAPYLVDPFFDNRVWLQKGDEVVFALRLFGTALTWLPFVLAALCQAGFRGALGNRRARFAMVQPSPPEKATEPSAWGNVTPQGLRSATIKDLDFDDHPIRALHILTPLKLREGGVVQGEIRADSLVRAVERRLRALHRFYGQDPKKETADWDEPPWLRLGERNLRWVVLERPSCTQAERVNIGGWVGTVDVEGYNAQAAWLMKVGQWTHVGKNVVYGCGKYKLLPSTAQRAQGQ